MAGVDSNTPFQAVEISDWIWEQNKHSYLLRKFSPNTAEQLFINTIDAWIQAG